MGLDFIAFEGDAVSERTTPLLPIEKLWEHHLPEDSLLRQVGRPPLRHSCERPE